MIAWCVYAALAAVFVGFTVAPLFLNSDRREFDKWQD
jgi:hypothetical protein